MTRVLEVRETGALTTVQDAGRPGLAHLGVPRSGWLDPAAARLANRLVGNEEEEAVLECLLGGLAFVPSAAMAVAVTGAECVVRVAGRAVEHRSAISVAAGQQVGLGAARRGARSYVAVSGGVRVEPVLGSRSTDTLSGLGPPPVRPGTVIPVGDRSGSPGTETAPHGLPPGPVVLGCRPGPRADWFSSGSLDRLTSSPYTVQPDSDRVGLRLAGPHLERVRTEELPSEGLVLGAVQVPADGQPLVFLNDHPTTGGYPVVAVVERTDLARCAQLRPGDEVRFRQVARA